MNVRSQDGINTLLVDLFERTHARNVLVEFGRAYGRFSGPVDLTNDEEEFLSQALNQLQDDQQRLIAVQLALFADMVSDKPWTGAVLKKLGGATGVGRAFLEENFDAKTANPAHKAHRTASIAVLKRLLPPSGTELKGTSQPRSALVAASGYQHQPANFEEVLSILTTELRLISPVAANEGAGESSEATATEPRYQLTHDYLVPSLRDWLTATDRETRRGRARLVLEERTEQWIRDPQPRHYPSIPEYLRIGTLVPRRQRSDDQQRLMRRATNYYLRRSMLLLVLLPLLLAPKVLWDYCTFQVEFGNLDYEQQRVEMVITRKWEPWFVRSRYRLGTNIFKDERRNQEVENSINQRRSLNTGFVPDWFGLVPLLSDRRLGLAEIEWLDLKISVPAVFLEKNYGVSWGRTTPVVVDALVTLLKDQDSDVRSRAAESLGQLGKSDPKVVDALVTLLKDQDSFVRSRAAASLGQLGTSDPAVTDALVTLLKDQDSSVRHRAAASLMQLGKSDPMVIDVLVTLLKDQDSYVSHLAGASLVQLGKSDPAAIDALVTLLKDQAGDVRISAAESLGRLRKSIPAVIDALVTLLKDQDSDVRISAAESLVQLGKSDPAVVDALVTLLKDQDSSVRLRATESLVELGSSDPAAIGALVTPLKDQNLDISFSAAASLGESGKSDPAAIDALVTLLKDHRTSYYVSSTVVASLVQLGKSDPAVIDVLVTLLKDQFNAVRISAAECLVQLGRSDPAVIDTLVTLLKAQDSFVRHHRAAECLVQLGKSNPMAIDALVTLLKDQSSDVRSRAAECLVQLGKSDPMVIDALVTLLKDQSSDVRSRAAASLRQWEKSDPKVTDALVTLLKDQGRGVREAAKTAIGMLGQKRGDWTDARMIADLANFDSGVRERAGIVLAYRDDKLKPETRQTVEALRKDSRPWVRQASLHALYHIENRKAELAERAREKTEAEAANAK